MDRSKAHFLFVGMVTWLSTAMTTFGIAPASVGFIGGLKSVASLNTDRFAYAMRAYRLGRTPRYCGLNFGICWLSVIG